MRRLALLFFALSICLYAQVIKDKKLEKIHKEKQKSTLEADLTQDSWINPLSVEFDSSKSKNNDITSRTKKAYLNVDQDIFRSGGIYYTIQKAKELKKLSDINYQININSDTNEVYRLVLELEKIDLQIKKQTYLIKNKTLEIEKKEAQYLNSTIDIEELDSAIIEKNDLLNGIEDLNITKVGLKQSLQQISSLDYRQIKPKKLKLVTLQNYLKQNSAIVSAKLNHAVSKYDEKITTSNYMPKVSIYSQVGYEDNSLSKVEDDYYNYGIKISIPIDYNMNKNKEISRLNYRISKLDSLLKQEEENRVYEKTIHTIQSIDKKLQNAQNSIEKYENIYALTKDLYEGLLKTKEDLKTIENRLNSSKLDIAILTIEKQILIYGLEKSMI